MSKSESDLVNAAVACLLKIGVSRHDVDRVLRHFAELRSRNAIPREPMVDLMAATVAYIQEAGISGDKLVTALHDLANRLESGDPPDSLGPRRVN